LRLIVITVIPRHPTSLPPTVERDISIGEAGDVSIGDLHPLLACEKDGIEYGDEWAPYFVRSL
jgi:hypothetical protein